MMRELLAGISAPAGPVAPDPERVAAYSAALKEFLTSSPAITGDASSRAAYTPVPAQEQRRSLGPLPFDNRRSFPHQPRGPAFVPGDGTTQESGACSLYNTMPPSTHAQLVSAAQRYATPMKTQKRRLSRDHTPVPPTEVANRPAAAFPLREEEVPSQSRGLSTRPVDPSHSSISGSSVAPSDVVVGGAGTSDEEVARTTTFMAEEDITTTNAVGLPTLAPADATLLEVVAQTGTIFALGNVKSGRAIVRSKRWVAKIERALRAIPKDEGDEFGSRATSFGLNKQMVSRMYGGGSPRSFGEETAPEHRTLRFVCESKLEVDISDPVVVVQRRRNACVFRAVFSENSFAQHDEDLGASSTIRSVLDIDLVSVRQIRPTLLSSDSVLADVSVLRVLLSAEQGDQQADLVTLEVKNPFVQYSAAGSDVLGKTPAIIDPFQTRRVGDFAVGSAAPDVFSGFAGPASQAVDAVLEELRAAGGVLLEEEEEEGGTSPLVRKRSPSGRAIKRARGLVSGAASLSGFSPPGTATSSFHSALSSSGSSFFSIPRTGSVPVAQTLPAFSPFSPPSSAETELLLSLLSDRARPKWTQPYDDVLREDLSKEEAVRGLLARFLTHVDELYVDETRAPRLLESSASLEDHVAPQPRISRQPWDRAMLRPKLWAQLVSKTAAALGAFRTAALAKTKSRDGKRFFVTAVRFGDFQSDLYLEPRTTPSRTLDPVDVEQTIPLREDGVWRYVLILPRKASPNDSQPPLASFTLLSAASEPGTTKPFFGFSAAAGAVLGGSVAQNPPVLTSPPVVLAPKTPSQLLAACVVLRALQPGSMQLRCEQQALKEVAQALVRLQVTVRNSFLALYRRQIPSMAAVEEECLPQELENVGRQVRQSRITAASGLRDKNVNQGHPISHLRSRVVKVIAGCSDVVPATSHTNFAADLQYIFLSTY